MKRQAARMISNVLTRIAKKVVSRTYSAYLMHSPELPKEFTEKK